MSETALCYLYKTDEETLIHLYWECSVTKTFWQSVKEFFVSIHLIPASHVLDMCECLGFGGEEDDVLLNHCLLLARYYASVNSSCAHPPPPGNWGAFACLVSPGGGALANLARPGGRAFAYPRAFDMHMWFPTRNPNMEDFIAKDQQFVADWIVCQGLDKLVEFFSILCISSLLIKAQLSLNIARSGTINVNRPTHSF